jgi:hypothetical protein
LPGEENRTNTALAQFQIFAHGAFPRGYVMRGNESAGQNLVHAAEGFFGRVIAIVVGVILMAAGIAMGVSLVLLPIGIPVGFAGLLVFLWGVFPRQRGMEPPARRSP